jgi:hypothetical protein
MSKHTYDIEFSVQSEISFRVQADSPEEAKKIAKDRFFKTEEFVIKSRDMDREIVMVYLHEGKPDPKATSDEMEHEYKYNFGKKV